MVAPILRQPSRSNRASQRIAITRHARLTLLALALACGDATTHEPPASAPATPSEAPAVQWGHPTPLLAGNQLRNPGFEAGTESWGRIGSRNSVGFDVVSEPTHSGSGAAHLAAVWRPGNRERPVSVRSAAQEISPPRFPDRVSGWYRVDRWEYESDEGALLLQIIVVAIGDPRTLEIVASRTPDDFEVNPKLDNYQLRYQLAGPSEAPEDGGNVKHRVIGAEPPELGTWQYFDLPVRSDFAELWGSVPSNYERLRIMFAVRWNDKEEGAALHADVYYDDLFFGFDYP